MHDKIIISKTLRITEETHRRLSEFARKGETYSEAIDRLLNIAARQTKPQPSRSADYAH